MATLALAAATASRRDTAPAQPQQGIAYDRLMLVMLLFAGAIFLIAARLAQLQVFADTGAGRSVASGHLPPRGDIVDRNGVVLARTIEAWAVGVQPANIIGDKVELAARLNELMPERTPDEYLRILNSDVRFTYLHRSAEPELVQAVNALGEPGITFGREPERLYPQAAVGAHVLGWVGPDGRGAAGIERAMQDRLIADSGRGQALQLSIDSRVQAAMEQ